MAKILKFHWALYTAVICAHTIYAASEKADLKAPVLFKDPMQQDLLDYIFAGGVKTVQQAPQALNPDEKIVSIQHPFSAQFTQFVGRDTKCVAYFDERPERGISFTIDAPLDELPVTVQTFIQQQKQQKEQELIQQERQRIQNSMKEMLGREEVSVELYDGDIQETIDTKKLAVAFSIENPLVLLNLKKNSVELHNDSDWYDTIMERCTSVLTCKTKFCWPIEPKEYEEFEEPEDLHRLKADCSQYYVSDTLRNTMLKNVHAFLQTPVSKGGKTLGQKKDVYESKK